MIKMSSAVQHVSMLALLACGRAPAYVAAQSSAKDDSGARTLSQFDPLGTYLDATAAATDIVHDPEGVELHGIS